MCSRDGVYGIVKPHAPSCYDTDPKWGICILLACVAIIILYIAVI